MKYKNLAIIFLWMLSVGYFYVIISFSAVPASQSSLKSASVTKQIVEVCEVVTGKKSSPKEKEIKVASLHSFIRKCAHVYNFAVFAMINCLLFYVACNEDIYKTIIITLLIGLCGAAMDEFTQLFVEGRAGQVKDVFIDSIGTILSCLVFFVFNKLLKKEGGVL